AYRTADPGVYRLPLVLQSGLSALRRRARAACAVADLRPRPGGVRRAALAGRGPIRAPAVRTREGGAHPRPRALFRRRSDAPADAAPAACVAHAGPPARGTGLSPARPGDGGLVP